MSDIDDFVMDERSYDNWETITQALLQLQEAGRTHITVFGRVISIDDILSGIQHGWVYHYADLSEIFDYEAGDSWNLADDDQGWLRDYSQEDALANVEDRLYVKQYLAELDSEQESIIRLHYGLGGQPAMTVAEIASEYALPEYTVRRRIKAGLTTLQATMLRDAHTDGVN